MKNWPQNLLILFSLGLCVLLVVQWHREDVLRRQLQRSDNTARNVSETISSLQSDVSRLESEAARVEKLRQQLSTNAAARELDTAMLMDEVESLQTALAKANQNIQVQNDALKKLDEERSEVTQRYNQLAEDYNNLVNRWNAQQNALTNAVRALQ